MFEATIRPLARWTIQQPACIWRNSRLKYLIRQVSITSLAAIIHLMMLLTVCAAEEAALEWPIEFQTGKYTVVVYQPQIDSYSEDHINSIAAVAVIEEGAEPVFGAVWFESRISTDRDSRTVLIQDVKVPQVKFPDATPEQEEKLAKFLMDQFPESGMTISLDRLLTTLQLAEQSRIAAENLNNQPPKIIFSDTPAVLIFIDGQPEMEMIEGADVMRVVNTPYLILFDTAAKKYFLRGGPMWFVADQIAGSWEFIENPPEHILKVAPELPEDEEGAGEEQKPITASEAPRIIVSLEPAELVVSEGKPKFSPIAAAPDLMFMTNTESRVFLQVDAKDYYILISGRWFKSQSLEAGPWECVPADQLPPSFANIDPESDQGEVLYSVAGTMQAEEAVMDATIPQTAVVKRDEVDLKVEYDGRPSFKPIEETSLTYAENTSYSVIKSGDRYYCCEEGVWYESGSPEGPWAVCVEVPKEIYSIPPTSSVYNVRYVYVYDHTPTTVYMGYLPGYLGCYVYGPTVVWGSGWRYRPWYGAHYYPRPITYGFHASYNFRSGSWSFGFGVRVGSPWYYPHVPGGGWLAPRFGAGFAAGVVTAGAWHRRHSGWWGPGGWHPRPPSPPKPGMRPPRPTPYDYRQNIYQRADNRKRVASARPGTPGRVRPSTRDNNVFTDRNGNVYRRTDKGWEKREQGGWSKPEPPPQVSRPQQPTQLPAQRPAKPQQPTTRPVQPQQPTTRPAQPQQPTTRPVQPQQPTTRPAQPQQPTTRPVQPQQPTTKPVQPQQPTTRPVQPQQPTTKPVQPQQPTTKPVQPQQPATRPVQPQQPTTKPVQPQQPTTKPVQPQQPATRPVQPQQPATRPVQPQQPVQKPVVQPQQPTTKPVQPQQPRVQQPAQQPRIQQPVQQPVRPQQGVPSRQQLEQQHRARQRGSVRTQQRGR